MYIERDLENNQLYVNFGAEAEDGAVASTTEVFPGVYLDVGPDGKLMGIDIANTKEAIGASAADLTLFGELLGVKEAAQLVGKDRGNFIRDLASRSDFPKPVARVASGQLWFSKDIERYLEKRRNGAPQEEPRTLVVGASRPMDVKNLKQRLKSLEPNEFKLIAVGSREGWLRLSDYPESTMTALIATKRFLVDADIPADDLSEKELAEAVGEVRAAVDELLAETDPLEVRRMLRSESIHREEAEKVYRELLDSNVRAGHMDAREAQEKYTRFIGSA